MTIKTAVVIDRLVASRLDDCLAQHGATLTADEHGRFWLNYAIESVEFGERVIDVLQLSIPLAARSRKTALRLAEVILRGHVPPAISEPETPVPLPAPPVEGYHVFKDQVCDVKRVVKVSGDMVATK